MRYKDGNNSISAADEQKALTLLTALKVKVAGDTAGTTDATAKAPETILPVVPDPIGKKQ